MGRFCGDRRTIGRRWWRFWRGKSDPPEQERLSPEKYCPQRRRVSRDANGCGDISVSRLPNNREHSTKRWRYYHSRKLNRNYRSTLQVGFMRPELSMNVHECPCHGTLIPLRRTRPRERYIQHAGIQEGSGKKSAVPRHPGKCVWFTPLRISEPLHRRGASVNIDP